MKALQIVEPGRVEMRDVPVPQPGPGQVLLKVLAVTTCAHWDMHILGGEPMFPGVPLNYPYTLGQPGHEACGEVAAVGEGVTGFAAGQRVCAWRDPGHQHPGCYAQYVLMNAENVLPAPREIPPEHCAPLELAMCVSAHVMLAQELDAVKGKSVGVFGLGPAGLVAVQLFRTAGASDVIGFDPLPERRNLALSLGADRALDPSENEAKNLPARRQLGSLHCSIDCVGSPSAVHRAMELTDRLVILFAVQREPYTFPPECRGGLILAGAQPHTREAAEFAMHYLRAGSLTLATIVTHVMPLEHYARAVELLQRREATKVAFLPHAS